MRTRFPNLHGVMTDSEAKALKALIEGETDDDLVELDPRWAQLAEGTLPAPEVEALLREGADSELQAVAAEALAPLDDRIKGRITEFAGAHYRRAGPSPSTSPSWRGWWAGLAALLAGAVAVMLVVPRPAPEAVPYEVVWRSGEQAVRSAGEEPSDLPTFVDGSRLQLDLRPETTPEGEPTVLVALDGWDRPLEGTSTLTPHGVVRIEGVVGDSPWVLEPGEHTLLVAIGAPGTAIPRGAPSARFQTFTQRFMVGPAD